ncbi:hypothetical protein HPP92_028660 [Vanilla planifolia]|uniref:Uncharacterized protein n=1 Tax=Vanilla planifolia TaxID=51239 RepID=A0A835P4Y6_VANPL|nr:hypothetical protein HPP92_028660 [Vanilla planifolia]KAG0446840.1 hypothetical protein HPP92_028653 [Vanilla planifolia]
MIHLFSIRQPLPSTLPSTRVPRYRKSASASASRRMARGEHCAGAAAGKPGCGRWGRVIFWKASPHQ